MEIYHQLLLQLLRVQKVAVAAYDAAQQPMQKEELLKAVQEANTRIENGHFITHEVVMAESKSW